MTTIRLSYEYLVDCNGTQAAIRSGNGQSGAHVEASRLLKDPRFASAVHLGLIKLRGKLSITRESVLGGLLDADETALAQQDPTAMIRAWSEMA